MSQQLQYYYKRINAMTPEELVEYRKKRSLYFKTWYEKNRNHIIETNKKKRLCYKTPKKYNKKKDDDTFIIEVYRNQSFRFD